MLGLINYLPICLTAPFCKSVLTKSSYLVKGRNYEKILMFLALTSYLKRNRRGSDPVLELLYFRVLVPVQFNFASGKKMNLRERFWGYVLPSLLYRLKDSLGSMKLSDTDVHYILNASITSFSSQGFFENDHFCFFDPLESFKEPVLCLICRTRFQPSSPSKIANRDLRHIPLYEEGVAKIAIFKEYSCANDHHLTASNSLFKPVFESLGLNKKFLFFKDFVIASSFAAGLLYDIGNVVYNLNVSYFFSLGHISTFRTWTII
jgi:hypothetical protein